MTARATSYGNPITFTAEERPAYAVDGDFDTAWRTAAFTDARGERLELTLNDPVTTDQVTLTQPTTGSRDRFITQVRLTFDDANPIDVGLSEQSRDEPGQVVSFPERTFSKLSIEILADTVGDAPRFASYGSMGFAEVAFGDAAIDPSDEAVRVPTDLLDVAGQDSQDHPLTLLFQRQRQDPTDVTRSDDERSMARLFSLPTERSFALTGEARLSSRADSNLLDALLGRPHDGSVTWVRASNELTGDLATPAAAFDGDDTTLWTSGRSRPTRSWLEVSLPSPQTVSTIPLRVVADGRHSVPTKVEVWVDGDIETEVELPEIDDLDEPDATQLVDIELPEPLTGTQFRLRFTGAREVTTNDWVSENEVSQPVAVAEVGLPGPKVPALPDTFDSGCRDDLLFVDDEPVPVRITGDMDAALQAQPMDLTTCDGSPLSLEGGDHEMHTAPGLLTTIDVDGLVLRSAAGGAASDATGTLVAEAQGATVPASASAAEQAEAASTTPTIEVENEDPSNVKVTVTGAAEGEPFWLVLGQSFNEGWQAVADGETLDAPQLVNGYANGWRMVAPGESFEVQLTFTPQNRVNLALIASGLAAVVAVALLVRKPRVVDHNPTTTTTDPRVIGHTLGHDRRVSEPGERVTLHAHFNRGILRGRVGDGRRRPPPRRMATLLRPFFEPGGGGRRRPPARERPRR